MWRMRQLNFLVETNHSQPTKPYMITQSLDTKRIATRIMTTAARFIRVDLAALPEEAFTKKFGDKSRTVADLIYETILVNDHVGMVIRGEEPFAWPDQQWITAPKDFQTKQQVTEGFEKSIAKTLETIENFTREQLEETIQTDEGETTRFERCQFMALHMWYHSGQLNFIQTMLGDDVFHWAE